MKAFVSALRDSGQVNPNKIGIVGGSAGATLAALVVLDTTDTNGVWPYWNASVRPVCAVLLSAAFDFSDRIPPDGESTMDERTVRDFENFTQTGLPDKQKELSPVSKVKTPTAQEPFIPLLMIQSEFDTTVPHHQLDDMLCTLQSKGISSSLYKTMVIWHSSLHAFDYWQSCDELPYTVACTLVRDDVIAYLDSHLK